MELRIFTVQFIAIPYVAMPEKSKVVLCCMFEFFSQYKTKKCSMQEAETSTYLAFLLNALEGQLVFC